MVIHPQTEAPAISPPPRDVCITVKDGVYCQQPAGCATFSPDRSIALLAMGTDPTSFRVRCGL
jgi:hypothetical protein